MGSTIISVNSYVYEAIQRKYRNSIVSHIRATLKAKYEENWGEQIKKPSKDECDKVKRNADIYG